MRSAYLLGEDRVEGVADERDEVRLGDERGELLQPAGQVNSRGGLVQRLQIELREQRAVEVPLGFEPILSDELDKENEPVSNAARAQRRALRWRSRRGNS